MFTEDKVREIFYWADEFCKFFDAEHESYAYMHLLMPSSITMTEFALT